MLSHFETFWSFWVVFWPLQIETGHFKQLAIFPPDALICRISPRFQSTTKYRTTICRFASLCENCGHIWINKWELIFLPNAKANVILVFHFVLFVLSYLSGLLSLGKCITPAKLQTRIALENEQPSDTFIPMAHQTCKKPWILGEGHGVGRNVRGWDGAGGRGCGCKKPFHTG